MASWSVGVSLRGKDGLSVLAGNGAPSPILGDVGQPGYIDVQNNRLYGPKTAQGWPTAYVNLQATLPNNLQGNSIILAPVQGETLATQITLKNSAGTTLFSVDATGALLGASASLGSLVTSGAATVGGSLGVTGNATASRFVASTPGSSTSPMVAFTASGTGTSYTCGIYSDNLKSEIYEQVADRLARSVTFIGTTPGNSDRTFFTHSFYSGVGAGTAAHRFFVAGGQLALQILGSADATFYGQLAINGLTTAAGVKLSSGALTFADGTSQSTASVAAATPATYAATSAGTAASPAFRYGPANNGAGLFFDGAQGNTFLSVNGFKSLYSTSAANAASGASGWAIASSFGAGSLLLALYGGASSTVPVLSVDGAGALVSTGLHKAAGLTLTSGALTFADGTAMTTAATGSGGSSASTGQLRYGTGAPTASNPAVQTDGDSYIDQQQNMLYGPRANGIWPAPVNLIGPTGVQGPMGATGATGATNTTFRQLLFAGHYWNSALSANSIQMFMQTVYNVANNGNGTTPAAMPMTRAGSVTGFSFNQVGPVSGTYTIYVYKNSTLLYTFPQTGTGVKAIWGTVAAGTYTFVAGDVLQLAVATTGSGNLQGEGYIEIQTT